MANAPATQPDTRLHGRSLALIRALWLLIALGTIAVFVVGFGALWEQYRHICTASLDVCRDADQVTPAAVAKLQRIGMSIELYAWYKTLLLALYYFVSWCIAGLIFWRRSDDWSALLVGLFLLSFGDTSPLSALAEQQPDWNTASAFIQFLGSASVLVFYIFPDGRFVPGWTRWLAPVWLLFSGSNILFAGTRIDPETWPVWLYTPLWMGLILSFVVAPVLRYRYVSNTQQRQQTKWVVFGFAGTMLGFLTLVVIVEAVPSLVVVGTVSELLFQLVYAAILTLIPISFGIAVLRSRLYDIDVIIRRTLIYGVLTGLLATLYVGSVVVLQRIVQPITGTAQSELVTVVSTLAIAALFQPLRRRVQHGIDRRFYRRTYDAQRTLEAFGARLRDQTDLPALTDDLMAVVHDTMQPQHVSVWLKQKP